MPLFSLQEAVDQVAEVLGMDPLGPQDWEDHAHDRPALDRLVLQRCYSLGAPTTMPSVILSYLQKWDSWWKGSLPQWQQEDISWLQDEWEEDLHKCTLPEHAGYMTYAGKNHAAAFRACRPCSFQCT